MADFFKRLYNGVVMAGQAFNQAFFSSGEQSTQFESVSARKLRHQVGWAFYEATQYDEINSFTRGLKNQKGLYKYIKDIYNPTQRIGNFYKGVIWRGSLDMWNFEGACPIEVGDTANEEELLTAIAHLWKVSNWNILKNVHVLRGAVLGDCALYIRDDIEHGQARMELLHPSIIKSVELDARGFVKVYELEETRIDERGQSATYRETCEHGTGDEIIFRTYKNNAPHAWDGNKDAAGNPRDEWIEQYGFVPLVLTQHINEGRDWGKSEIFSSIGKITTIDDEASLLHDQIRKTVNPFKIANFVPSDTSQKGVTKIASEDNPQPGREQENILWVNKDNAAMTPVITPLDIVGVSANIKQMLDALEKDLPELQNDVMTSNISNETLLAARAMVESKVIERRINYDSGLVAAHQMAIAIGGYRGYEGYKGFDLDSFRAGKLDHSIAERPVFPETEDQKLQKKIQRWTVAADVAQKSGGAIPAETVLLDLGMTKDELGLNEEDEVPDMPTARMNAIKAQQEDTIPQDGL